MTVHKCKTVMQAGVHCHRLKIVTVLDREEYYSP